MKVLVWSQYFWPENFHINTVTRALRERGLDVTVLTGKPNYPEGRIFDGYRASGIGREDYDGVDIVRIPLLPRGSSSALCLIRNYMSFVVSGYLFAPFALRKRNFDVVFVYAPSPLLQAIPAIFVAWLKHAPLVLWVQDLWPQSLSATGYVKNRWALRIVESIVRCIYRYSDLILIPSEAFRPAVAKLVKSPRKIQFFPNSTADVAAADDLSGACLTLAAEMAKYFAVVFAGNIGRAQACETIVGAARLLHDLPVIRFYLVGSGSMAGNIARLVAESRLENVVMTGRLPPEDMAPIYGAASVLLLTLADDPALAATVPSKLQAYLAAGKPVIVSSNGEAATVVNKAGAGLASPAGDADALAGAVRRLYAMGSAERLALGRNSRKCFLDHYHLPKRVSDLIVHFESVAQDCAANQSC